MPVQENSAQVPQADATDNSLQTTTPEPPINGDNSQEEIKEPENNLEGASANEEKKPKFNSFDEAVKAHAALETKLGEQSSELGELRKKAKLADELQAQIEAQKLSEAQNKGFNTVQEFEDNKEITNYVANEYAKYLEKCDYPDEMAKLLAEYRKNPSKETLEMIEADFPTDVLKTVAGNVAILKGQLQQKHNEALETQYINSAKAYLEENVSKYENEFKNPHFLALYSEAFKAYGCDLQTDKFVELMNAYAQSAIKANNVQNAINTENTNATDELAGLSGTGSSQSPVQEKNILEMTPEEIRRELRKH